MSKVKNSDMGKLETKTPLSQHLKKEWRLYTFFVIPILFYLIFRYLPMVGNVIAFRKYQGGGSIFGEKWVGLRYFKQFIGDKSFWRAFVNTLQLNLTYIAFRFPLTLIFALLLNEIRNVKWKKFVQTASYLPHFIAVVVVCGMVKEIVSVNGPINHIIQSMGHDAITFIDKPEWFTFLYVVSGVWQALGWGTILYLASMANINTELYDAAKIDGANHFRQVLSVTIPGILPTITTLLILDVGSIVSSNAVFEKILLLYNPMTYETADVVSTYVYRMGVQSGNYSYATAVGLFEGVIGLILVTIANISSKKIAGSGLW